MKGDKILRADNTYRYNEGFVIDGKGRHTDHQAQPIQKFHFSWNLGDMSWSTGTLILVLKSKENANYGLSFPMFSVQDFDFRALYNIV